MLLYFFSLRIIMGGKNIILMIKRSTRLIFIKKKPSKIDEVDVDKILVSKRESNCKKVLLK